MLIPGRRDAVVVSREIPTTTKRGEIQALARVTIRDQEREIVAAHGEGSPTSGT